MSSRRPAPHKLTPPSRSPVFSSPPAQTRIGPEAGGHRAGVRVVVAVGEALFGDALAAVFRSHRDVDVVAIVGPSTGVVPLERARVADLAVVDADVATQTGRAARLVAEVAGGMPTLLVNHPAERRIAVRALLAGVRGYVTADASATELVDAVRGVARGEVVVPPSVAGRVVTDLVAELGQARPRSRLDTLTRREREVLRLLAEGAERAAIARRLTISPATARTHVANILRKLRVHSRLEAVALFHAGVDEARPGLSYASL